LSFWNTAKAAGKAPAAFWLVRQWRKKALDKHTILVFNSTIQTVDAEVKLTAHPKRAPVGGSGVKSGSANGPLRVRGNADAEYDATRGHALVAGGLLGFPKSVREIANQGGTANKQLIRP